mgnify:CR=1 FL=1
MVTEHTGGMDRAALEAEIERLHRVLGVLMDRAKSDMSGQGSDFSLIQTALTLELKVEERYRELKAAHEENERAAQQLYCMTRQMHTEIEERKQAEKLHEQQYRILEMIAGYNPLDDTLRTLVSAMEEQLDGGLVSIVLLDEGAETITGSLGDSLPDTYSGALVGVPIGPGAGSCGTAMYRREAVVTPDINCDPLWDNYRDLALAHGLHSCWSTPILTSTGEVLGSFAIYNRAGNEPSERERRLVDGAVHLAGVAIQRNRDEARVRYMAHHDSLTHLPNRTLLQDRIELAVEHAKRAGLRVAVLMIDLDRFKHVNDSLGHHVGDQLLQEVAQRLDHCVRNSDTLARLGGDEFVVCMPDLTRDDSVAVVASKILRTMETPFIMNGQDFQLGASIGISLYPDDGDNVHDLLRTADTAMYAAKGEARSNYRYFTDALNQAAHNRMALVSELQQAIRKREFTLYYQPQFRLSDGALSGSEALLRWQHPTRGLLGPAEFMDVLEEHGLISEVGGWVLQAACQQNCEWPDMGGSALPVAVNIAADQFYRGEIIAQVRSALGRTGMDPALLTLEFTETVLLRDSERVLAAMHELRGMGVKLALDDFGTGYSSLSYLHRFPVQELKIDRSFIQSLNEEKVTGNIVASILHLAETLELKTVAEGLETAGQQALLKRLECSLGQGFFLGRPMPATEFRDLLARGGDALSGLSG